MDKESFSALYNASRKELYGYCRKLCGNSHDADDLMQQTYLKAWENFDKFDGRNLSSWLCSIARNTFLNNLRNVRNESLIDEYEEIPDNSTNPEFIAEKKYIYGILLKALKNYLSPAQRMTVILYYYDEKSVSEISGIMHCPKGTVESRLCSAREKLRRELKKSGNIFTYLVFVSTVFRHKLKNIHIPVNARITVSAVVTAAAMVSVSMASIPPENKFPDTVIKINETYTSENLTTTENKTVIQTSSETAFIAPVSHATTNSVYYTMPADESRTTAFKSEYEEISETETEEPTTKGSDNLQENTSEEETINEYEEVTTMKKEIISAVTAITTAFAGTTAAITTAVDETENPIYEITEETEYPTDESPTKCEETDETSQNGVEITFPVGIALCIVTPTGDNPRRPNVPYTGDAHVTFSQTDEKGEIIKEMGEWNLSDIGSNVVQMKFEQTVYSEEETVYFMWTIDNIDEGYYPMWGWEETPGVIHSTVTIDPKRRERLILHAESNAEAAARGVPDDGACPIEGVISLLPNNAVRDESTTDGMYLIYGDANLDKNVTISDSVAILQNIANNEKYPLDDNARANADVYNPGDGITGSDANSIMKLDAGIIDSLPEVIS